MGSYVTIMHDVLKVNYVIMKQRVLLVKKCFCFDYRMQDIVTEMNLICSIVSIPVMEPLNSYRLNKIMLLTLGCIDIAMYASSGYLTSSAIGRPSLILVSPWQTRKLSSVFKLLEKEWVLTKCYKYLFLVEDVDEMSRHLVDTSVCKCRTEYVFMTRNFTI